MIGSVPDTVSVLVVDDQPPFRRAASSLVARTPGFTSAGEAATGEDAVAQAGDQHPDLVLMDINLPGINGIEATRRILAAADGDAPLVVLISTYPIDDLPADARTCGARGYVRKEDLSPAVLRSLWDAQGDPAFGA